MSQWIHGPCACELAKEERRSDRSALAVARLLDVCHLALDLFAELFEKGHAPHLLARIR